MSLTITDVPCIDCGGEVTAYMVPDKVWKGLGLASQDGWICLKCLAHRLNPDISVEEICDEIVRQQHRFNLKNVNRYQGVKVPCMVLVVPEPGDDLQSRITMAQFSGREPWPKKPENGSKLSHSKIRP
jgi:hypothetical protein